MIDGQLLRRDGVHVLHKSRHDAGDELAAVVPARARQPLPAAPAGEGLSNVVPFMRPPDVRGVVPALVLPSDLARLPGTRLTGERVRMLAFAAVSLLLHGGLFAAFWREPAPLASIGVEVMSVEIVVGATAPAGVAQAPGEQEVQAAAAPPGPQPAEPQPEAEQQATAQPQTVPVAPQEKAPEQTVAEERPAEQPKPVETEVAQLETTQAEPKPSVAMVESPQADTATAKPREVPSDTTEVSLLPQPEEKPAEPKPEEPKPTQAAPPKPVKNAAPAKERTRVAAPTKDRAAKQSQASTPSTQANNVGVGRSDNDTNYRGLVAAHLARHKQYPSDARSRGDQGTAAVTFGLDGGGRVTWVRLARGSGVSSIDSEVTAMVHRASPFPAPPSGRSVSFTVPVSFRLN